MKKLIFPMLMLCLASTSAQAQWKGNFVLGFEAGYASREAELNMSITDPAPAPRMANIIKNHPDSGLILGILGGYQVQYNRFLLGLEGNVSYQDFGDKKYFHAQDASVPPDHYLVNAEHDRGAVIGLTLRAGFELAPWVMPYVRAGAQTSDERIILGATNSTQGTALYFENERRAYRFIGGAGFEFPLWLQAVLRLEYNYSSRGRGAAGLGVIPVSFETISANIKPNQHEGKIAFVWNFVE